MALSPFPNYYLLTPRTHSEVLPPHLDFWEKAIDPRGVINGQNIVWTLQLICPSGFTKLLKSMGDKMEPCKTPFVVHQMGHAAIHTCCHLTGWRGTTAVEDFTVPLTRQSKWLRILNFTEKARRIKGISFCFSWHVSTIRVSRAVSYFISSLYFYILSMKKCMSLCRDCSFLFWTLLQCKRVSV